MRALHPRGCGSLLGSAGLGAWHLPALSWVPYRLPVSSRLCGSSGVFWVGGLASPGLMLGNVYAAGMFVFARLFWGRLGRGLGIPRPIAGCLPRGQGLVVSCAVSFSSVGLWL